MITLRNALLVGAVLLMQAYSAKAQNCELFDFFYEVYHCENSTYSIDFEFKHNQLVSDSFAVFVRNRDAGTVAHFGNFPYSTVYVTIGDLPQGVEYEILIRDLAHPNCVLEQLLPADICESSPCVIEEIIHLETECDGGLVYVNAALNLKGNTDFVTVDIFLGGNTPYINDLTLAGNEGFSFSLPAHEFPLTMTVCDVNNPDCCVDVYIENPCASGDCEMDDLFIDEIECDDDLMILKLNFNVYNPMSAQFDVTVNGVFLGSYPYAQLPVTLHLLADETTTYHVIVTDHESKNCSIDKTIGPLDCSDITATDDVAENNLSIFPNPAHTLLNISDLRQAVSPNSCLRILNITGNTLMEQYSLHAPYSVDISSIPNGYYVLQILSDQMIILQTSFVKQE